MTWLLGRIGLLLWAALMMVTSPGNVAAQDASPAASPASPAAGTGIEGATAWLLTQQAEDGGFIGFSGVSDPGVTIDAILALVAAEGVGIDTGAAIEDAVTYLESGEVALVYTQTGVGQAAKFVLGLVAAGEDPQAIATVDPLSIVQHGQDSETGIYGAGFFDHALAMMALTAVGAEVPQGAIDALAAAQAEDGGWAFDASSSSDSNTTAMAVQALVAAGQGESDLVTKAVAYLQSTITPEGAVYAVSEGAIADANSTALVLQALIAVGDPNTATLANALATFQGSSGAFFYQSSDMTDNLFSTVQAIPATVGVPLPVMPAVEATPVAGWLIAA
jgi:hypothetical protein